QFRERAADAADGLADALLVLDEREAHEALTAGAEADAGRDSDLCLRHEHLGELEAAHLLVGLGDRRPDEHRAPGPFDLPSAARQAVDECVAPAAVDGVDLERVVGRLLHRYDGRDLKGLAPALI